MQRLKNGEPVFVKGMGKEEYLRDKIATGGSKTQVHGYNFNTEKNAA